MLCASRARGPLSFFFFSHSPVSLSKTHPKKKKLSFLSFPFSQDNQVVTSANRALVVEALRSAAELVVWGDRHDSSLVDFFLEAGLLAHYADVLDASARVGSSASASASFSSASFSSSPCQQPSSSRPSPPRGFYNGSSVADQPLAAQVLQSAAILVANVRSRAAAYYLFSGGGHLERLISSPQRRVGKHDRGGGGQGAGSSSGSSSSGNNPGRFVLDLSDDEVAGQYVGLLKAVASRLDENTVQCFCHDGAGFPNSSSSSSSSGAKKKNGGAEQQLQQQLEQQLEQQHLEQQQQQQQQPHQKEDAPSFPLLDAARSLLSHREPLVRAAARALTLQIYSIPDAGVQDFVSGGAKRTKAKGGGDGGGRTSSSAAAAAAAEAHFEGVARGVAELSESMRLRLAAAEEALLLRSPTAAKSGGGGVSGGGPLQPPPQPQQQALTALENVASELEDCLGYCHDVLVTRPREAAAAAKSKQGAKKQDNGEDENDDDGNDGGDDRGGFERVEAEAAPSSSSFDSSSGVSRLLQRALWKHAIVPRVLEPLAALAQGRAKSEEE